MNTLSINYFDNNILYMGNVDSMWLFCNSQLNLWPKNKHKHPIPICHCHIVKKKEKKKYMIMIIEKKNTLYFDDVFRQSMESF